MADYYCSFVVPVRCLYHEFHASLAARGGFHITKSMPTRLYRASVVPVEIELHQGQCYGETRSTERTNAHYSSTKGASAILLAVLLQYRCKKESQAPIFIIAFLRRNLAFWLAASPLRGQLASSLRLVLPQGRHILLSEHHRIQASILHRNHRLDAPFVSVLPRVDMDK